MKKTLAILLAATGMAMGEINPLTLDWQKGETTIDATVPNDASFSEQIGEAVYYNSVTLVAELNWSEFLSAGNTNGEVLFTINDNSGHNHGLDLYVDNGGKHLDAWVNDKDTWRAIDIKYTEIPDYTLATNAALVFASYDRNTSNNLTFMYAYLYLSFDNGQTYQMMLDKQTTTGWNDGGFDNIASFSYNDTYINKMDVYNTYDMYNDYETAIKNLISPSAPTPGDGNIPEPTTATLSLLALAGLAARRRRK